MILKMNGEGKVFFVFTEGKEMGACVAVLSDHECTLQLQQELFRLYTGRVPNE